MKREVSPLVAQVLSGEAPDLALWAAQGLLPLPPAELIPLQVELARRSDPVLADNARLALRALAPKQLADFLAEDASAEELSFFAAEAAHPMVLDAILRRGSTPHGVLVELARRLAPEQQEIVLLREDAILAEPKIIEALAENPSVSPFAVRRIAELRAHLLARPGQAAAVAPGVVAPEPSPPPLPEATAGGTAAPAAATRPAKPQASLSMGSSREVSPLVVQVLSGEVPELRVLAAQGLLPLVPAELIPLQVWLAKGDDLMVSENARVALRALPPRQLAEFLAEDAAEEELAYFAREVNQPAVIEAILRRPITPRFVLVELAKDLAPDLQEILLLREDAIVEEPAILQALEENPRASAFTLRRIAELREHVLARQSTWVAPVPGAAAVPVDGQLPAATDGELSDEELAAALAQAQALPASGDTDEITGLTEGQIRMLAVGVRMRLSRGATRTLRQILIRDTYPPVALSVLENNTWSDQELEQLARNRAIVLDVLEAITRKREWIRKYPILLGIACNPRTPVAAAMKLVPMLGARDLRNLSRDRNVSDAVRSAAVRLYRMRTA
jgi:hypothetical protein